MRHTEACRYDVIVVGAGPVGLFVACELSLAGCTVLVLERAFIGRSPMKEPPFGLRGLTAPTIDSLDRRGLLEELVAWSGKRDPASGPGAALPRRAAGHFSGIPFFDDHIDAAAWGGRVAVPLATDMASLETVLVRRAEMQGVQIRRGFSVETLTATDDDVTLNAGGETFKARWLVGCDGGRSTVRKAAAFTFSGTEPEFTGYSVEVTLADPTVLTAGRNATATGVYNFTPPQVIAMADFDGGACHRIEPTRAHVEAVLRKVSGRDVEVLELNIATTWTDRAFHVGEYRRGRVLLAGDAAHVHSPLGGQGLNLGLGDAMNLGWKLAATIRGEATDALLDTYEAERRPIGAQVLNWSRAQVALMRPGAGALRAILQDLMETRDGASYFAERVSGVGLRYDLGDPHPLVGRSAPDWRLVDGRRLAEVLRRGRGITVSFTKKDHPTPTARWGHGPGRVWCQTPGPLGLNSALIRPDGVIRGVCHDVGVRHGYLQQEADFM